MGRPAHSSPQQWLRQPNHIMIAGAVVAVAALVAFVAAGAAFLFHSSPPNAQATPTQPTKDVPLTVVGTNPAPNDANVSPSGAITVSLSAPLASGSPQPTLTPPIAGKWSAAGPKKLQFVSSGPLVPGTSETLTVPGGPTGLKSKQGNFLASSTTVPFTVAPGSTLRLQQLLAQLGYLPVTFTPAQQTTSPQQAADPQQGTFNWRWPNLPGWLTAQWAPGSYNVMTQGAVMDFEYQHSLYNGASDTPPGAPVWAALLQAASAGQTDPNSYNFVYVAETVPQTVTVFQNGQQVYQTPANTGVAAAPTAQGTFAVFEHATSVTMSGYNPDGSYYSDPGVPWDSYFNGGDALHGFDRASYGSPQSDGCVEMPPANAQVVYPYTPIGTLVTVGN